MKKVAFLAALVLLLAVPFTAIAVPYDKDFVVAGMRANLARVGAIKQVVAAGDFFAAASAFFDYATLASALQKMDPPKGSAEDWAKLWNAFQDKAFAGIGACGQRDAAAVLKILDELVAINKIGHPEFRF